MSATCAPAWTSCAPTGSPRWPRSAPRTCADSWPPRPSIAPAPSSLARTVAALRCVFAFCVESDYVDRDAAHVLRTPKKREALPDVLDHGELGRLLDAPDRGGVWRRVHAGKAPASLNPHWRSAHEQPAAGHGTRCSTVRRVFGLAPSCRASAAPTPRVRRKRIGPAGRRSRHVRCKRRLQAALVAARPRPP